MVKIDLEDENLLFEEFEVAALSCLVTFISRVIKAWSCIWYPHQAERNFSSEAVTKIYIEHEQEVHGPRGKNLLRIGPYRKESFLYSFIIFLNDTLTCQSDQLQHTMVIIHDRYLGNVNFHNRFQQYKTFAIRIDTKPNKSKAIIFWTWFWR